MMPPAFSQAAFLLQCREIGEEMLTFLRCTVANKATVLGYLGLAILIVHVVLLSCGFFPLHQYAWHTTTISFVYTAFMLLNFAFTALVLESTGLGYESYRAYRRAENIIAGKKMNYRAVRSFKRTNCTYVGYRLAMKEHWPSLKNYGRS